MKTASQHNLPLVGQTQAWEKMGAIGMPVKELTQMHQGTAEGLAGFYWFEQDDPSQCSCCHVSAVGVEFIGQEIVFNHAEISGKFWKIERPT